MSRWLPVSILESAFANFGNMAILVSSPYPDQLLRGLIQTTLFPLPNLSFDTSPTAIHIIHITHITHSKQQTKNSTAQHPWPRNPNTDSSRTGGATA